MIEGKLRSEGGRAGVRFERRYDFAPEEVWSALTDPVRLGRWLTNVVELELRAGGRFLLVWNEDDGDQRTDGRIRAREPDSVARFELRPDGDGTILVLDHRGLAPAAIAGYGAGWHSHLDSLDAHLAGRETDWSARFEELGPAYERQAAAVSG